MADTLTTGRTFIDLRRRKVVQWVLAYVALAWTLLQVLEYLAETYDWPPAIRQIAVPALSFGSLFVLVLAWYHGDKGAQKVSRPEFALLTVVLLLVGGSLWWFIARLDDSAWLPASAGSPIRHEVPTNAPSVAVLPFVNMSSDPEQEYFSDGLSEEILNALARTPGLYVPARTSSFQFKGQAGDVAKFAAMLGVATVLEGSVRKADGRVRVTAQLINAADGYHLWSQTYDRELKDIFAIQSEIATAITEALKLRLTAQQKLAAEVTPSTNNLDAYEAYLLGRHAANKSRWTIARKHFEQAILLDPQFAEALAWLSIAVIEDRQHYLPSREALSRADELVDAALALAPRSADVLLAAGLRSSRAAEYEKALGYYDAAIAANPGMGDVMLYRANILSRLETREPWLVATREAVRRDPLSLRALHAHVLTLDATGHQDEIASLLDRMRLLDEASWHRTQARLAIRHGNLSAATKHLLLLYDSDPATGDIAHLSCLLGLRSEVAALSTDPMVEFFTPMCFGEYDAALPPLRRIQSDEYWSRGFLLGEVLYGVGQFAEADTIFRLAWDHKSTWPTHGVGSERLMMAADCARRVGALERAQAYRDMAGQFIRLHEFNDMDPGQHFMAMVSAYDGRDEDAVRHLVAAIAGQDAWQTFPHRPLLAGYAGRIEVREAIKRRNVELDRQRAEVLQMLCGPDPVSRTYKPSPRTCADPRMAKR